MQSGEPHTRKELITLVCWFDLKQVPVYKFQERSRPMALDISLREQSSITFNIKKHTFQHVYLSSVHHYWWQVSKACMANPQMSLPMEGRNKVDDPDNYRQPNWRTWETSYLGKETKPEDRKRKKRKRGTKHRLTFRSSQRCIASSMICNGSFRCFSPRT